MYKASVDNVVRMRSISGATPRVGTGTSTTSAWWEYDENGDLTVGAPDSVSALNYTCKDLLNLATCRGDGYSSVDYEMHKDIANLWMAIKGRRNSQGVNGAGANNNTITGGTTTAAAPSPLRETTTGRPRTLGLEDWWGNVSEWMDGIAVNVPSYDSYKKNKSVAPTGSPVNGIWHIKMPDGTERKVQGMTANYGGGIEIARMRNGRYCDVIPSSVISNGNFNTYYCDGLWYTPSAGRCVLRSGNNTYAFYGLVYCYAYYDSASSYAYYGARLAFRGEIEVEE